MPLSVRSWVPSNSLASVLLVVLVGAAAGCGMAGFGGSLQLNVTDQQTRTLTIEIDGGADDARVIEIDAQGEVELGTGKVTIDRYALHRTRFGSSDASAYFLCPKPCSDPLSNYLVAYSPEQVFRADGQIELRFRIESADGTSQELSRAINAEMLPALWQEPKIEASAAR
jgi:hypothetical protein